MEIFLEVQVFSFLSNYGHWWPDRRFISHPKHFPMACCYRAGHFSVRVFSTKQVLFTALECSDSAHALGFRWPKVHCSAQDTWPNTHHVCLLPLQPFASHVSGSCCRNKGGSFNDVLCLAALAWCFWLAGTGFTVEAISNISFCCLKRSSGGRDFVSEQHIWHHARAALT